MSFWLKITIKTKKKLKNTEFFLSKQNFSDIQLEESRGGARLRVSFKNQPPLSHPELTQRIQEYNNENNLNLIKIYYTNKEVADENFKYLLILIFSFLIKIV